MASPEGTHFTEYTEAIEEIEPITGTFEASSDSMVQPARSERQRGNLRGRQQIHPRHTDLLSPLENDSASPKIARQLAVTREENRRLRSELAEQRVEIQQLSKQYNASRMQTEQEIRAIHRGHQLEIEQYQSHLRDMLDEHRQLQETNRQLEQRYQDLYHSFQNEVEEEAQKLVSEAASTVILSPERTPALLQGVVKTLQLQVKQEGDTQVSQALYLTRSAHDKTQRLEQDLAREWQQIAAEREKLIVMQNSVREQAALRYKTLQSRLRGRWVMALTLMTSALLLLLPLLQSIFFYSFKFSLQVSMFAPIVLCIAIAAIFARLRSTVGPYYSSAPRKVPVAAKPEQKKPQPKA
ncbi:MAG: GAS domain-containing protein [Chloroflexota bacterium]|nr:GAS domain-containing protein [Chloroflexota bacterium]